MLAEDWSLDGRFIIYGVGRSTLNNDLDILPLEGDESHSLFFRRSLTRAMPGSRPTSNGLHTFPTNRAEPKSTCRAFRRRAANGRFPPAEEINHNGDAMGKNSSI